MYIFRYTEYYIKIRSLTYTLDPNHADTVAPFKRQSGATISVPPADIESMAPYNAWRASGHCRSKLAIILRS